LWNRKENVMKRQKTYSKTLTLVALAALLLTCAVREARRVQANPPSEPDRSFGMVGITRGQTLRLNVVNLVSPPPDPDRQYPPPCRVLLSFRDAQGQPFTNSDGQALRRVVELQAGESAFLDLNADMFGGPSTNADVAPGPARLQLRPFVRVLQNPPDPDRQFPPDPCRATLEVFDNASGRTSVFAAGFQPPPEPDRGQ
jgi:hypothetical protein